MDISRKCERLADGATFAVKIVSQRFQIQAMREAKILQLVNGHPNIVRLIDVVSDSLHIYLVMEILEGLPALFTLIMLVYFFLNILESL